MYQLIYELLLEGAREKQKHEITRAQQLQKNVRVSREEHNKPIFKKIKEREEREKEGLPVHPISRKPSPEQEQLYKKLKEKEGKATKAAEKVIRGAVKKVSGHEARLEGEEGRRRSAEEKAKAAEAKITSDPKAKSKKSLRRKRREAVAKGRLAKLKTAETRVNRRKAALAEREKLKAQAEQALGLKYKHSTGDIESEEKVKASKQERSRTKKTQSSYEDHLNKELENARARENAGMSHRKGYSPEEIKTKLAFHKKESKIKAKEDEAKKPYGQED
jgi:hypothetical protein